VLIVRPHRIILAATALAVLLSGCTGAPTPTSAGSGIPTGFESIYEQQVFWNPCTDGFDCTTVSAPVDWSDPESDRIQLAVVRQESTNTTKGSLLTNPGGPGGSGFDLVSFGYAVSPAVKADYDVIGWDPRGVGRSTRVTCFTDSKDTDDLLYGTFDAPYESEGWLAEAATREQGFADACAANSGELLAHMDTASTARDMDLIRAVLASDKLNYVGYSWGTYLGTVYAQLFPQNVGTMVLDGGYDPSLSGFELYQQRMVGFDLAFRSYMQSCLETQGCPFSGDIAEALGQATALIATADGSALANADGRVLNTATLATAIANSLYYQAYWDDLTTLLTAFQAGDPGPAFDAADNYNGRFANGSYPNNELEVEFAVACVDYDFAGDQVGTRDRLAQIDAAAPILGTFIARDDFARLDTACRNWPVPPVPAPASFDASTPPIVVVGTTLDPATPYAWSQALVAQLSNAVLVTRNGDGHTGYNKGNACVDSAVDAYLLDGVVPASDPNC
jgi:pimeloyl-ACP methyl ester carboxylesterase